MIGEAWLLNAEPLKVKGFLLFVIFRVPGFDG